MGLVMARLPSVMKTMAVLAIITTMTSAEGFVTKDVVIPEQTMDAHGHLSPEDQLRKLWASASVRKMAEVSLLETESQTPSAATATALVAYSEAVAAVQEMGNDNSC